MVKKLNEQGSSKNEQGSRKKAKKKPKRSKQEWEVLLWDAPSHHVFFCIDGSVFKNTQELEKALASMSKEAFAHHVNDHKNDFSTWIYDIIGDVELADELRSIKTLKRSLNKVASRVKLIKKKIDGAS